MSLGNCKGKQRDTTTNVSEWLKWKKLTIPNADRDAKQKELSFIVGGNAKRYSHFGRQFAVFYKAKQSLMIQHLFS